MRTLYNRRNRRRGAVVVLTAMMLVTLVGFAVLSVDVGNLLVARTQLQVSADAAALAAAWELLDEDRLVGASDMSAEIAAARQQASAYGAMNFVLNASPIVDFNYSNAIDGDIVVGYLSDPSDRSEVFSTANLALANTVQVRVRRNQTRNGPVATFFAGIFGRSSVNLEAEAYATFKDGVVGYDVTPATGNAELLPFALDVTAWGNLLNTTATTGDNYAYDPATGHVSAGWDGINELNIYPGAGASQLPPGNFGTVDIGSNNNSTADLARQIVDGVNDADLAYHGGTLDLRPTGSFLLNGDTGLSAGIKDELASIIGQPRAILLFDQVTGPGNNAMFRIVGFAGVRIMAVKLTGPMNQKHVIIQPAFVVDDATITDAGSGPSYFVYQPVHLVR